RTGDGSLGAADSAPFDGIVVTAMAPGQPPPGLFAQLAPGAAFICPVGRGTSGHLMRYRRDRSEDLGPVGFVPLIPGSP
ncbi:MAG: protein-L-isoaspartate O-methyltransferase family protein, partial [Sciscionella sp.]